MSEPDRFEDAPDDSAAQPAPPSPPGAPRWVKVTAVIVLVAVVVLVVLRLTGVEHGPGRHGASGGAANQAPAPHVAQDRAASTASARAGMRHDSAEVRIPSAGPSQHDAPQP